MAGVTQLAIIYRNWHVHSIFWHHARDYKTHNNNYAATLCTINEIYTYLGCKTCNTKLTLDWIVFEYVYFS